jgi:hypothetical protein
MLYMLDQMDKQCKILVWDVSEQRRSGGGGGSAEGGVEK